MLRAARLSFGGENVKFPRMNYRRKKISMKERLEEAIQEIGGELLQGPGFMRELPEETSHEIEPAAQSFASRALEWTSTEESLRRLWQRHEAELPTALVQSKVGFAAFEAGLSGLSILAEYEMTRHGHNYKMDRTRQ
jgi:hypothetical protein